MPPPVPWPYLFFIFTSCSSTVVHGASGLSPLTLGGSARPSLSWPFFSLLPLSLPVSLSFPLTLPVSALFHCIILSIHGISYLCLAFAVKLHLAFPLLSLQARLPHRRRASPLSARRREPLPLHLLIRSCRWCKFASCHAIFMHLNVALIFRISVVIGTLLPTLPLC